MQSENKNHKNVITQNSGFLLFISCITRPKNAIFFSNESRVMSYETAC